MRAQRHAPSTQPHSDAGTDAKHSARRPAWQIAGSSFGEHIDPPHPRGAQSASLSQTPNSYAGTTVRSSSRAKRSSGRSDAGVDDPAPTTGGGPNTEQPAASAQQTAQKIAAKILRPVGCGVECRSMWHYQPTVGLADKLREARREHAPTA